MIDLAVPAGFTRGPTGNRCSRNARPVNVAPLVRDVCQIAVRAELSKLPGGSRYPFRNKQRPATAAAVRLLRLSDTLTNIRTLLYNYNALLDLFFFLLLTGRAVSDGQGAPVWSYAMLHLNCILEKTSSSTTCFTYLQ